MGIQRLQLIYCRRQLFLSRSLEVSSKISGSSSPLGPTVCITYLAGRLWPRVILASPVLQRPRALHSFKSPGPAALWMAPSTPSPPLRDELAAFTIASIFSFTKFPNHKETLLQYGEKGISRTSVTPQGWEDRLGLTLPGFSTCIFLTDKWPCWAEEARES